MKKRIETAERAIRRLVKDEYFSFTPYSYVRRIAENVIIKAVEGIDIPRLKSATVRSLWAFFEEQWRTIMKIRDRMLLVALLTLDGQPQRVFRNGEYKTFTMQEASRYIHGRAMHIDERRYFERYVKPTFERLIESNPKDPDDLSGRNTLRNRAEMEMRYAKHLAEIEALRSAGVKLVIASSHIDASARCRPWQGRVYSLDGSTGTTADGRPYEPLEVATDIYYTTKAGITYKNGLLGFNCRHYLVPYKDGLVFSAQGSKADYAVTQKMREMEREIRRARTQAMMYKGKDKDLYKKYVKVTRNLLKEYRAYCKGESRKADYSRTKIL